MVSPMHTRDLLADKLAGALSPTELQVDDESHKHAGHAGARPGGGSHFSVRIVSSAFEGKSLVARHRLVYAALADELAGPVHALALRTLTPAEAESEAAAAAADDAEARIITGV